MTILISLLRALFRVLPLSAVRLLGRLIGRVMWQQDVRSTRVTKLNIAMCYPTLSAAEQEALAHQSVLNTGVTGLELFWVWCQPPQRIFDHIVNLHGHEAYQQALSRNEGLFVCAPHFGNWEVVGLFAASQGPMTSMYAPLKSAAVDKLVKSSREATNADLVPTDTKGVRALLKALKSGAQVGILPDQRAQDGSGIFSPFFGHEAYTPTLMTALQRKAKSPILGVIAARVANGWELHFIEPDEAIYDADQQRAVNAMNQLVEQCVAVAPAQYQWEYKRFAKQQDGSNPYDVIKHGASHE